MTFVFSVIAGCFFGILSSFGIGGGTIFLLYMTIVAGLAQTQAQCINLLFFIPTALAALYNHSKSGLLSKTVTLWAAIPGACVAILTSLAASSLDTFMLKKLFGFFLIAVGVFEFFKKLPENKN